MTLVMVGYAAAADLPVYSKAPPPAWSWTGLYVGVQGGAGSGTTALAENSFQYLTATGAPITAVTPVVGNTETASYGLNGWHGGGTAGINWQAGPIVLGVEGDISGANINGKGNCNSAAVANLVPFGFTSSCSTDMTWFGTVTGRLGLAVDRALFYVKGGPAFAQFNHEIDSATAGGGLIAGPVATLTDNRSGVTAGVGVEYAFLGNWSAKLEYDYMDFGTKNLNFASAPYALIGGTIFVNNMAVREQVSVVKAGLNYRFNWGGGPLVSNY
jgi:outer membrane immunogenic protein